MQYTLSNLWQGNVKDGDRILAMLTIRGTVIARISGHNFSNVAEIVMKLKELCANQSGLAQCFIRNFNEGWHYNRPIFLRKPATKSPDAENLPMQGKQYLIAWS